MGSFCHCIKPQGPVVSSAHFIESHGYVSSCGHCTKPQGSVGPLWTLNWKSGCYKIREAPDHMSNQKRFK